ncbi:methyltransferase domain-containing protein [Glycomyces artemisiae]|uniref:Methyltransferase family protein n=1 Tax=Glycomyces artemisiae TaxID=1076443 RepID=A0A2T0UL58_9ACTN|nr:methyltransferase domain-containing protein [Glycomyces artemisiae]PRY58626.1 methyltransferase family protein [Glycomyces artemisiae]
MTESLHLPFTISRHLRLLLSTDRGHNVARAVLASVRPGDHVLDAGTGTGLLALLAARAGAERVTAVDREHLDLAREIAAENGVPADAITFVEADLDLRPFPDLGIVRNVDLLLAFIYGNHPLTDEARARMVFELRRRYGTPDCTVVPNGIRHRARGCDRLDWDLRSEQSDLDEGARTLQDCYGLDFGALVERAKAEVPFWRTRPVNPIGAEWRPEGTMSTLRFPREDLRLLTEPADFGSFDYAADDFTPLPPEVTLHAAAAGRMSGIVWTQDLMWAGRVLWSTESYSPLAEPVNVTAGDKVTVETADTWRRTNTVTVKKAD